MTTAVGVMTTNPLRAARLLGVTEAARRMDCAPSYLRRLLAEKSLGRRDPRRSDYLYDVWLPPMKKLGGRWRIGDWELDCHIERITRVA